jgi:hypothetical protein
VGAEGAYTVIGAGFEVPHFTIWNVLYTATGAAVFWGRNGRSKLKVYYLSHVFDIVKFPEGHLRQGVEFSVFIILGCLMGIGIAQPGTVPQAITAGMAWTGFLAKRV